MPSVDERWVSIEGLERYAVSNFGRVINQERGNELTQTKDKLGYLRVCLSRNGVQYKPYVHRLVAFCFLLNYRLGMEVKHINGDLSDNGVLNLTLGGLCRSGNRETAFV